MGRWILFGYFLVVLALSGTETSAAAPFGALAQAPLGPAITHYDFDVTVGSRAPDCFRKA